MTRARIIGTGSAVPARVLKNTELETSLGTGEGWIVERTGIRERRVAEPSDTVCELAAGAGQQALAMAGVPPEQLDLIVVGTVTPDAATPSTAAMVQARLGARRAFAFDVSAACAGSLVALSVADQYLRSGAAHRALVIGADLLSRALDFTDRNTCILFGDAAGALVLAAEEGENGLCSVHLHCDGTLGSILGIPAGGKVQMNGREVFRVAVRCLVACAQEALEANGLSVGQLDHVMAHQANQRILEAVASRLGVPFERFWMNLDRYANTSAASLPMCFDEAHRAGRLAPGDRVLLLAAGAGFVWGSALLRW
jgi:3-oxoacyl-[acyl-carrier-protein] synthase-3